MATLGPATGTTAFLACGCIKAIMYMYHKLSELLLRMHKIIPKQIQFLFLNDHLNEPL